MNSTTHATTVSFDGDRIRINGHLTNPASPCEGLLMNSRMVQATFDDLNPKTRDRWAYPDGTPFDATENTRRFCAMLPTYAEHGLNAVTINLQGGSPQGYSQSQPWENTAFTPTGELREAYLDRAGQVLDETNRLSMVTILGLFYFGQDHRLEDEAAVCRAVDNAVDWLLDRGDQHVLIEIANEADLNDHGYVDAQAYSHEILQVHPRGDELIRRVQERSGGKLLCSTSYCGGGRLTPIIAEVADFILLHGNGIGEPEKLREHIRASRQCAKYHGQPIIINEDDHFDFDQPTNNMRVAIEERVGWGYFDYRRQGEPHEAGYQSVPTDWGIDHPRKRGFFDLLERMTRHASARS